MSRHESDDIDRAGYFLPEDSQFRLKKLRDHMEFLSHLAQPRTLDEEQDWVPEIRMDELAVCLELLAEQAELVLEEVSWRARRNATPDAAEADEEAEAAQNMTDVVSDRFIFGVTLGQIDTLNLLIDMISAHGDVVTASDDAELADHTLSLLGHAIYHDAKAVRGIVAQVETQRLGQGSRLRSGVGEERGIYAAGGKGTEEINRLPLAQRRAPTWPPFNQATQCLFHHRLEPGIAQSPLLVQIVPNRLMWSGIPGSSRRARRGMRGRPSLATVLRHRDADRPAALSEKC